MGECKKRVNSVRYWHADINDRDIWVERFRQANGLLSIGCFGNNLKVLPLQQRLQALAYQNMVISEHDAYWHGQPPMGPVPKALFHVQGRIRREECLRSRSFSPAWQSIPALCGSVSFELGRRQSPLHHPGSNNTMRLSLSTRESRYSVPLHA